MPSLAPVIVSILGEDNYSKSFKKLTGNIDKIGKTIAGAGKNLTAGLTVPIVGMGVAGLKMSKDFNKAMASVGTLIPGQADRLSKLKKEVMDLGVATGQSSNVIAEGLYETISAFGSAEDPMNKLNTATRMSVAGMSTVKEALSLVSAVTKGYGDVSDEAANKVSDLAFKTVEMGQTTFPELAASMGKVVPLATTLNVKQHELFGGFATLTGVTGNAAEVSTQLAAAFGAFLTPSEKMIQTVKQLGYESSVAMIKELGLQGSLEKLKEATGGDEIAMGKLITRKEGLNAALTLLGPQAKKFSASIKEMGKAAGSTDKAFNEQTNGINKAGFAFDQMMEKMRVIAIQIGDKLSPILLRLMERITPLIDSITGMSDESLEMGLKIAGAVAMIGPALIVLGKLTSAASAVMAVVGGAGGMGAVFAALTGPVGLAIAAVAGFTAAVIYLWDEIGPIREALLNPLKEAFEDITKVLTFSAQSTDGLGKGIKDLTSFMSKLVAPVVKLAVKFALLPMRMIARWVRIGVEVFTKLGQVVGIAGKAVSLATGYLSSLWESFLEGTTVGQFIVEVFNVIGAAADFVGEKIKSVWETVTGFFGDIGSFLGGIGDKLDAAIADQQKLKENKIDLNSKEGDTTLNQSVLQSIEKGKEESSFNITIEGLGKDVNAKVTKAKGGKVNLKTKGSIMGGAL